MAREDKLVKHITKITKIALGEEPNKDFSEAMIKAMIKAAKVGYSYAVDEACEWLKDYAHMFVSETTGDLDEDDLINAFRKAMVEKI